MAPIKQSVPLKGKNILKGRYRHFKGGEYEVLSVASNCDNPEQELVVYRALYGEGKIWVRLLSEFIGFKDIGGKKVERFEKIGDEGKGVCVRVKRLREDAVLPKYAREGDAAMDVVAVSKRVCDNYIEYGTGLAFEVPEGHVMLMFPRSSNTKSDLILGNSVGVLDSGYRGELMIRFNVIGDKGHYEVGDRIVQIMILPCPEVEFVESEELSESSRGEGRFGSTGK